MFTKTEEIELNDFLQRNVQGKIPFKLISKGSSVTPDLFEYRYQDIKTKNVYVVQSHRRNIPKLKIKELASIYKTQPYLVSDWVPYLYDPEKFENASLAELQEMLGDDLSSFLSLYNIEKYAPTLIANFTRHYFLHLNDFFSARLPNQVSLSSITPEFTDMAEFEGYWTKDGKPSQVDENIKNISKALLDANQQKPLTALQLTSLRDVILTTVYGNPTTLPKSPIYPLPNSEKWPEQDNVVAILTLLSERANTWENYLDRQGTLLTRLKSNIPEDVANHLLLLRLKSERARGHEAQRLAFPEGIARGDKEFTVLLLDGSELKWTEGLIKHIQYYNVKPSREFLEKMSLLEPLLAASQKAMEQLVNRPAAAAITPLSTPTIETKPTTADDDIHDILLNNLGMH